MIYNSQTIYPYFLMFVSNLKYKIYRRIEFKNLGKNESPFLFDLLNDLDKLELSFEKHPTISNVNFEKSIRSLAKQDREIDGVQVNVFFKGKDAKKMGQINFYLKK